MDFQLKKNNYFPSENSLEVTDRNPFPCLLAESHFSQLCSCPWVVSMSKMTEESIQKQGS